MSSQYTTEPPPTASVLLHTTAGPLTISLFANQTPLTCRNFLQHVLDEDYNNNIFHRVSPGFVIQTGDSTGTGEGGQNIYEEREFARYDEDWARVMGREKDEKIQFGDEIHSRLKFNRRGLVGMAKGSGDGAGYGSQFFITLGDCRAQLDGKCTMFGRIEGDGIYNVVKVAEGELLEGTERPMYPEKILRVEILEMPKGDAWQKMQKRVKVAERTVEGPAKKKATKKKGGKTLLSFGGDEGEDDAGEIAVRPKKAKFNPTLIDAAEATEPVQGKNGALPKQKPAPTSSKQQSSPPKPTVPQKRRASPTRSTRSPSPVHHRKPSFHDPTTQLPLRDPESPSRSPTPENPSVPKTSSLQAEIAALKASMRRNVAAPTESTHKKSALESLIPSTSTRGRKRPRPGESHAQDDANALKMLNAFRARLDTVDGTASKSTNKSNGVKHEDPKPAEPEPIPEPEPVPAPADDEEAALCDLHFIANCQSCSRWDEDGVDPDVEPNDDDRQWMSHSLSFAKDRLGKDLTWKRKNEEELVVIDPREKEKELKSDKRRDRDRDRIRDKEKGKGRDVRW
ncbi:Peptidyl-prolyl isomerase cwc27 [Elasticomyces elasticus]|uniref:Peptidyl-prolyl isomerase cwc27 n=1 Tax=Exophiala sideris TaxID=1016849 RepID=A0ABR0JMU9_9EURO|nr:Peptidyl-prolyl isomerase cwc27 [Elasticomyces elasticus]KAK5037833.1 Peptidyl-prolyl isomerase cwc27 [Exophiala sideris]KAK5043816.1 Peptidyl-prolyl isomerase cwc27 [Exophiala sideris]KAK5067315.1 Peptidyl-prolyl isomerase cwc27 [Exophiala sideris]KAK5182648.1 Peptidyl-prolyl isomerase cwc27 [Eurotiomycetes sp. CCFEE 6388]